MNAKRYEFQPDDILVIGLYGFALEDLVIAHRSEVAIVNATLPVGGRPDLTQQTNMLAVEGHIVSGSDSYFNNHQGYSDVTLQFTPKGDPIVTNAQVEHELAKVAKRLWAMYWWCKDLGNPPKCSSTITFQQLESVFRAMQIPQGWNYYNWWIDDPSEALANPNTGE